MTAPRKTVVTVTTDSSGDATAYTSSAIQGAILNVIYTKTDFADGVDFTITTEDTGQNVWVESNVNASKTVSPHQPTHDTSGTALVYAAAGEPVDTDIYAAFERIKIVVASGGDTKTGTFTIIYG